MPEKDYDSAVRLGVHLRLLDVKSRAGNFPPALEPASAALAQPQPARNQAASVLRLCEDPARLRALLTLRRVCRRLGQLEHAAVWAYAGR